MSEENKAILRRFIEEVLNKKNLGAADQFMAPNFVDHDPASPGAEPNIGGVQAGLRRLLHCLPRPHIYH